MNYRIKWADGELVVDLRSAHPGQGPWRRLGVRFEGAEPEEILARVEDGVVTLQRGGRFFNARVARAPAKGGPAAAPWEVLLAGEMFAFEVARDSPGARAGAPKRAGGPVAVKAPMPGRVVAIRVKAGDRVAQGDLLLTLEAMKMQNEFGAPVAGRVREVTVKEGAIAGADETLVLLDAEDPPGV